MKTDNQRPDLLADYAAPKCECSELWEESIIMTS